MGNVWNAGRKKTFKWRIEGFSSLYELPEASYISRPFNFGGYSWNLRINPKNIDIKSGKECMCLYLQLEDASSLPLDLVLHTVYELCVYDQICIHHRIFSGECYFQSQDGDPGFSNIILHDLRKHLASGFLLNDTCAVSVKFLKVHARKVDCSNMFQCFYLQEKPATQRFTWKIENFTKLPRPEATSKNFGAGVHKWNIRVYPDGKKSNGYLGIFLELHPTLALPFRSELYAESSLRLLDQINGHHKKFTAKSRFSEEDSTSGLIEFLSLEVFQDPLNGFLVENACLIEASVMVLGASTRRSALALRY